MTNSKPPLVDGGQGRSAAEEERRAMEFFTMCGALLAVVLVALSLFVCLGIK